MSKIKIMIEAFTALLFIAIIIYIAGETSALEEHEGTTNGNETWEMNENPHIIKNNFIISMGNTVTIENESVVKFEKDASLIVEGNLIVKGEMGKMVLFNSNISQSNDGDWKGIEFKNNGTGVLEYFSIKYSEFGISTTDLVGESIIINHLEISNSSMTDLNFVDSGSKAIISNISSNSDILMIFENSTAILTDITANNVNLTLKNDSEITARDIQFENIKFEDGESKLIKQWHIDIKIIDENEEILHDALITISDNQGLKYQGISNSEGYIRYIYCTEYINVSDGSPGEVTYLTPHNIKAQKDSLKKEIFIDITESKEIIIMLEVWNHDPLIRLLYPTDFNTIIKDSYILWWYGEDLDDDDLSYQIYLYNKVGNSWIKVFGTDWQKHTFYQLKNLENGNYKWKIRVSDGKTEKIESEMREFIVRIKTYKPEITLITPLDNEKINSTSIVLKWQATDKDNVNLTYDVYYDYINASQIISENQTGTVFYISGLRDGGQYYWRVVVNDGSNQISSETRSFKIKLDIEEPIIEPPDPDPVIVPKNNTPPKITLLSPGNEAIIITDSVILKYNANDADGDNLTYDIYLDTNDASTLLIEAYKGIEYPIEDLVYGKTYYWKVIVKDSESFDSSLTWNFKVEQSENIIESQENDDSGNEQIIVDPVSVAIGSTIAVSSLLGYLALTENGRYKFLQLLMVPLYTRLKKDKILMNDYRTKMYTHIKENPGVHLRSIMNNFNLKNGAAIHHLTMLERNEYIKSMRDGSYRRYYPKDFKILKEPMEIHVKILLEIKRNPGVKQKDIAKALNISRQVASYHIEKLKSTNKITFIKDGKINKYYLQSKEQ